MAVLKVPYVRQISEYACGAAVFEMVFRYFKPSPLSKFSQRKTYSSLFEFEPHGTGNYRIKTDDLVKLARERKFASNLGRVSPDLDQLKNAVIHFIEVERIPLIVCQRYTDQLYVLGHFRLVIGTSPDGVILHDPDIKTGGPHQEWSWEKLHDFWKQTGSNVTGGIAVWINNTDLSHDPLLPAGLDYWRNHQWPPSSSLLSEVLPPTPL